MDLRLFSIEQVPRSLPVWETILDDLGSPSATRIAKALDVGVSTVYRWNADGSAPRMACLALFWLTRWGRSEIDARATNDAMTAAGLARSLHEERTALRTRVQLLTDERDRLRQVVQRFMALREHSVHGSAATADRYRMGIDPVDSWALEAAAAPGLLGLPAELLDQLRPARRPDADRGSPAAPPPEAHSTRSPATGRTAQPRPSEPREVAQSWPSASLRFQSDAILTSADDPLSGLMELRQAQHGAAPASRAARAQASPAPARSCDDAPRTATEELPTGRGDAVPRTDGSAALAATADGHRRQVSATRLPRPAASCSGAAAPAPALMGASSSQDVASGQPGAAAARPPPAARPADPFDVMCASLTRTA